MNFINLTNEELLKSLYEELKAEGAVNPKQVIENFLTYGSIVLLFTFEKRPVQMAYEDYSKVKSEILHRNRRELKETFAGMTLE